MLLANALLKAIPARWIAKIPTLDESKALGGESKLMSAYDTQSKAKAFSKKGALQVEIDVQQEDDDEYKQVSSQ